MTSMAEAEQYTQIEKYPDGTRHRETVYKKRLKDDWLGAVIIQVTEYEHGSGLIAFQQVFDGAKKTDTTLQARKEARDIKLSDARYKVREAKLKKTKQKYPLGKKQRRRLVLKKYRLRNRAKIRECQRVRHAFLMAHNPAYKEQLRLRTEIFRKKYPEKWQAYTDKYQAKKKATKKGTKKL